MSRQQRKSSGGFRNNPRKAVDLLRERDNRRRPSFAAAQAPDAEAMLAALAKLPKGATANQLATAMKLTEGGRELSTVLRRLVEQGQVLEIRPGRYQVSGSGGEHAAVVEPVPGAAADSHALQARFPDGRVLPLNPIYLLGAKAGDVVQVAVGEDDQALVTRLLRRTGREVVGTIQFRPGGPLLIPDNRKDGQLPVLSAYPRFHDEYNAGDRVVGTVAVDGEGQAGVHLTRILGKETPEITDFRYVCLVHDLPAEFPPEVEEQASAYRERMTTTTTRGPKREDLRQKLVYTIDPATAKDFDDAISLEPRDGGGWILGVHIADVSHYVVEQTPLDAEAAVRGTSIYLINRVIPMLPESLSNGLCSLVPNKDRYCLSAFLSLDKNCTLVGTRLAETVINSRHRFTYEEALAVLEQRDEPGKWPGDVIQVMRQTGAIAQTLRKAREKAGALNLHSVERRFALDVEGQPVEIGQEGTDVSHQLIEECMLLANRAVAEWLEDKKLPCIYRIHEQPDEERLKQFAMVLEAYGKDGSRVQNRFALQKLLYELVKEPPAARLVLNYLCLRSFKKAVYAVDNIGHFALSFRSYAHFTSPIRRYPDLLVHRLVKRGLGIPGYKEVEIRKGYLDALAKQSSWLEQRAEGAERDLHARKATRYLAERIGETFPGVVVTPTPGGVSVQLMETGMEGFVPMRELQGDFWNYDQERMCLVGKHSGRLIRVGDELDVLVVSADIDRSDVVLGLPEKALGLIDKGGGRQGGRDSGRGDARGQGGRDARQGDTRGQSSRGDARQGDARGQGGRGDGRQGDTRGQSGRDSRQGGARQGDARPQGDTRGQGSTGGGKDDRRPGKERRHEERRDQRKRRGR